MAMQGVQGLLGNLLGGNSQGGTGVGGGGLGNLLDLEAAY